MARALPVLALLLVAVPATFGAPGRAYGADAPRDKEAIAELDDLQVSLGARLWVRVRTGIEGFAAKHPDASEAVLKRLEALKTDFAAQRLRAFAEVTAKRFEAILKDEIRTKVGLKDATFGDVQAWIRKQCLEDSTELLWKELQKQDPAVTVEEVRTFFDARAKTEHSWRLARYGSGSFLVDRPPDGGKPIAPRLPIDLPKAPTRDEWWAAAPPEARAEFWWAAFVENGGLYEVDPKRQHVACIKCEGDGTVTLKLSNGEKVVALCPRCGGARFDDQVKYR